MKKIPADSLKLGMYVSELDRPWTETNFLFQGLLLETYGDIERVQSQCEYVYIESDEAGTGKARDETGKSHREFGFRTIRRKEGIREILRDIPHGHKYPVTMQVEKELANADHAFCKAAAVFRSVWGRVRQHRPFQLEEITHAILPIVNSMVRNPDAFLLLRTLSAEHDYNTRHATNSCALATAFGRYLGLSPDELTRLALGAFLLDIGKARLPDTLLYKPGPLNTDELALLKSHATLGMEILKANHCPDSVVIDMVASHHEHDNGGGYPAGLDGNQIPVYARMAALVDSFDAISIERPYKKPLASHVALQVIGEAKGVDFQEELTNAFVLCMGVYPTGSIVELSNGFVAAVIEQHPEKPRQPRVMLLRSEDRALEDRRIIIDLGKQSAGATHSELEIADVYSDDHTDYRRIRNILCMDPPDARQSCNPGGSH